ncbi:DUF6711 family protein [Paenibacillus thailandensis]|uniref:DUF6711 family protein n=1 Tax=Paenibacillus thailandensis TaxID=393250 RepID=A0ABW5QSV9_9BACL
MALIEIDGKTLPSPSDINFGIQDISKAERNANGTMIIERIATKRKIELSWTYLSPTQLAQVLSAVKPVFFDVTYTDPETNAERTATFYCGDRSVGVMDFINGNLRYKSIKFSLIER